MVSLGTPSASSHLCLLFEMDHPHSPSASVPQGNKNYLSLYQRKVTLAAGEGLKCLPAASGGSKAKIYQEAVGPSCDVHNQLQHRCSFHQHRRWKPQ